MGDDQQGELFSRSTFPVATGPLARTVHPATSKTAWRAMRGSEALGRMQGWALDMVTAHPGSTANDLARLADCPDTRAIPKRLRELERAGLIYDDGTLIDPITRRAGVQWWPGRRPE